ncbi:hypothetical protein [Tichowtungia aerotolerans]|uniref:Uncharacterized protein n=1 Tax=Tichowtungia aerotolerans TaxID=2697043 RepID=A0A6P1MCH3_9BACT|nr:hypothetical protein [Tichowtungia aerotolerans]QHI68785.1 hypothetical protein GT409_04750 [Tichowtungia aerotolerans]
MKRFLAFIVMFGLTVAWVQADWFVDDFERADTTFTNDASVAIGDGYVLMQLAGDQQTIAKITSGRVEFSQTDGTDPAKNIILYNSNIKLANAQPNESFTVEGDIQTINVANGSSLQGLAFNVQPDGSFYAARIDTGTNDTTVLQFVRANSEGGIAQFTTVANSVPLATNTVYHLKISSLEPGAFTYELTGPDLDGGQLVGAAQETSLKLENGYAGFFASASFGTEEYAFDNLSIETTVGDVGSFVDSYTRSQTVFSTNAAESIGPGYVMKQLGGDKIATSRILSYKIQLSQLSGSVNANNVYFYYTGAEMQNSGSNQISIVEGDIDTHSAAAGSLLYGLVFNVQPDGSHYIARINTGTTTVLQFLRVTSAGAITSFSTADNSTTLALSSTYHMKIETFSPGSFRYTLTGPGLDGGALSGMVQDTALKLADGYAGFHASGANVTPRFDSLSVKNITVGEDAGWVDDFTSSVAYGTFDSDASVSIGDGYVLSKSSGDITPTARIMLNAVQLSQEGSGDAANDIVLRYSGVETLNAAPEKSFVVEGDLNTVNAVNSSLFNGLAFNVQSDGSFYAARINTGTTNVLQFIRVTSAGAVVSFGVVPNTVKLSINSWYHLKIESEEAGVFKYRLTGPDLDGGVLTGTATDTVLRLEDGTAGFYASKISTQYLFDNLSIGTYTTEILAGYDSWAAGWGVDLGAMTADYDGDKISNLAEYALGGDPTNALDGGEAPSFTLDGSGITYVYPQRSDDDTLTYLLKITDDLVGGAWSNAGYSVINTNITGGTLDYVTNTVSVTDPQLFIKLEVQQD